MKTIRIFISSPGDVAEERERARQVVEQLRRRYAGQFDLKAVLWEDLPLQPDMSFQQGIDLVLTNERGVDIAVFILWARLGTPTGALVQNPRHGGPYRSGTDREFDLMRQARLLARGMNLSAISNELLPCGWLRGPDDVTVRYRGTGPSDHMPHVTNGVFLNINAEDFGIEVDRAIRIELPDTAVICDGEILSGCLLGSPIGLFEVEAIHSAIQEGSRNFRTSILFFNAERHNPSDLEDVIESFLEEKRHNGIHPDVEQCQLKEAEEQGLKFDLCPASRNVIRRCMKLAAHAKAPPAGEIDVFISFASEDQEQAQQIHDWLTTHGRRPVFFSPESIRESDFSNSIFSALDQAKNLVVVGSKIDHLRKNWVSYECRSFFNKMMREPNSTRQIFIILADLPVGTVPPAPLDTSTVISCSRASMPQDLAQLLKFLP